MALKAATPSVRTPLSRPCCTSTIASVTVVPLSTWARAGPPEPPNSSTPTMEGQIGLRQPAGERHPASLNSGRDQRLRCSRGEESGDAGPVRRDGGGTPGLVREKAPGDVAVRCGQLARRRGTKDTRASGR